MTFLMRTAELVSFQPGGGGATTGRLSTEEEESVMDWSVENSRLGQAILRHGGGCNTVETLERLR